MSSRLTVIVFAGLVLASTEADAHIALVEPLNRYGDSAYGDAFQKSSPCGHEINPQGFEGPFVFQPGEVITVRIDEYVGHTGFFRIALAESDQDFIAPTGVDDIEDDPSTLMVLPDPFDGMHEIDVTLPDTECTSCVLQVIQVMTNGSGGFAGNYYQCADIIIGDPPPPEGPTGGEETAGTSGSGGGSDSTTGASTTTDGTSGGDPSTSSSGGESGAGSGAATEPSDTDAPAGGDSGGDSGCSIRSSRDPAPHAWWLLALAWVRRRRR